MTAAPPLLPAAPETVTAYADWLRMLSAERRLSPKTVEAYGRDVRILLVFLQTHLGGPASLADLAGLSPRDVRAFMAQRRSEGLTSRSLMRALAAARSFARHLARTGKARDGRLRGRPQPQDREEPAQADRAPCRRDSSSTPTPAPARSASRGFWRATPPCSLCSTAAACASRRRCR